MPIPDTLRVAFIGGVGHHYLQRLDGSFFPGGLTIAVANDGRDERRAREFAGRFANPDWYDDPLRMLDEFRPHVVSVGSVHGFIGDWNVECLRRGLPVVSEKPVAATWEQFEHLRDLANQGSPPLVTEFDFRSRPAVRTARRAVRDARIGEPILATAQKSYRFGTRPDWYGRREWYAGTLPWIGGHAIDAIWFVSGKEPVSAFGYGGNLSHPELAEMEDHVTAVFRLENGGSAVIHADYLRPGSAPTHGDDRLRIVGTEGQIEIRNDRCELTTNVRPPCDITDHVDVRPLHLELLAAALGDEATIYGTKQSLQMAGILLATRDAIDQGREFALQRSGETQ